ncbi:MAG TPA: molybdenum cofactor guanylyltransferase [Vicinamibacterales bacterium]|nr:molybdenum cofactor guanylyltransferase [Vicinamibacterales bacterium]
MRSAAILAGGLATRFGRRDKSALVVEGRSIVERQVAALVSVVDDLMIVGGSHGARPGAAGTTAIDIRVVHDIVPGCGPLGGLHAALTSMRGDRVFVAACDMPYIEASFVDYLLSIAGEAAIVVPETDRGYHPLCAVYTRACLDPVAARLAERRLALRELFRDVPTRIVTVEEMSPFGAPSRLLANVNTPAEYAHLEALQGHKP